MHSLTEPHSVCIPLFLIQKPPNLKPVSLLLLINSSYNLSEVPTSTPSRSMIGHRCTWLPKKELVTISTLLLDRGADIEAKTINKWTPLHQTPVNRNYDIAGLLIDRDAKIDAISHTKWTPLHYAISHGHDAVARLLIDRGANLEAITVENSTPLPQAIENGRKDMVELLIQKRANLEAITSDERTPLHNAIENKHDNIVNFLTASGADTMAKDSDGSTPLHLAARNARTAILMALLDRTPNLEAITSVQKRTPLRNAIENKHRSIAEILILRGSNIHAKDSNGWTPLHFAGRNLLKSIALTLLNRGADVNAITENKSTPLHLLHRTLATKLETASMLRVLQLANRNSGSVDGERPSRSVAKTGIEDIVDHLLEQGANINAIDAERWTPLHHAISKKDGTIARILIEKGANVKAKNTEKETPLHCAAASGLDDIAELLLDKGAVIGAVTNTKRTPLHYSTSAGHLVVSQLLIRRGASSKAKDKDGKVLLAIEAMIQTSGSASKPRAQSIYFDRTRRMLSEGGSSKPPVFV
jgi:ankyrin repeat protein